MRFHALRGGELNDEQLKQEYSSARAFANVRIGDEHIFFRTGLRQHAASYKELKRCYRRVMQVPMKLCCGKGSFEVDYLVLEDELGEAAQLQMPGRKAAVAALEYVREKCPSLETRCAKNSAEEAAQ